MSRLALIQITYTHDAMLAINVLFPSPVSIGATTTA